MNCLWPVASRASQANSRIFLESCHKLDILAARLTQRSIRPYSISSLPFRRRDEGGLIRSSAKRSSIASNPPWSFGIGAARAFASQNIITRWEKLPESYEDRIGIPFRSTPLSKEETLSIFGKGIDVKSANQLLSVWHGRRVAGTLDDPESRTFFSVHEQTKSKTALEWLRKNVPVDEIRSAGLRAERELAELDADAMSQGERAGLYKPNSQPRTKGEDGVEAYNVYGESVFDKIRARNEKAWEEEQAAAKAKKEQEDNELIQNSGTLQPMTARQKAVLREKPRKDWLQYYLDRAKILPDQPPEMTMFQRLWPSGLLMLGIVSICVFLPLLYTPPKNSQRMFPDIPPAAATVLGLIAINVVVFGFWHFAPAFRFMNKYFITVPGYPFALSTLGSLFSHQEFYHLAINMITLYFVGTKLHDEIGRANFLALYLSAGILGSFTSLSSWVIRNSFISSSLGASGAVGGIISGYLWLNKDEIVTFFGFVGPDSWLRIPCWVPLIGIIAVDAYSVTRWNKKPIKFDHWAHLGGYAGGIAAAELIKRRAYQRRQLELERRKNLGIIDRIREGRL